MYCSCDFRLCSVTAADNYNYPIIQINTIYRNFNSNFSLFQVTYEQTWRRRFRWAVCCACPQSSHDRDSFAEVSRLLADFFYDFDVVPTDLLAGLMLMRRKQRHDQMKIAQMVSWHVGTISEQNLQLTRIISKTFLKLSWMLTLAVQTMDSIPGIFKKN